jgi:hypothetical protein
MTHSFLFVNVHICLNPAATGDRYGLGNIIPVKLTQEVIYLVSAPPRKPQYEMVGNPMSADGTKKFPLDVRR